MDARTLSSEERLRWARAGMLSALAIVLGYLESFVPIPIPGVKLGLANIAVLIALMQGETGTAVTVGLIKVLASGLLFGNPLTMAYSAVGTALSLLVMVPLSRLETLHPVMLSVAGAVAHETGQLLVAQLLLGTSLVWYSAPPLMVAAVLTGALCGFVAMRTTKLIDTASPATTLPASTDAATIPATVPDKALLLAYVVFVIAVLRSSTPIALGVELALALGACAVTRMSPRMVARSIRPMAPIMLITVIAQVASMQAGEAVMTLGPIAVTREALVRSATMVARLSAIAAASGALMTAIPREHGADLARWLLSPLAALGVPIEGPVLALDVAMGLVPTLAQEVEERMAAEGLRLTSPALWRDIIPDVVAWLYACASRAS